jgi:adenosine kinase
MKQPVVKPGKALICGSVAFDTIMVFQDRFRNHILPDKVHMLNVSFLVPQMRREFGGCAGNIAYNLKLLGDTGYPMATVGHDFDPYRQWLARAGVPLDYLRVVDSEHTAQGFVTTDLDDNQIWAFHPGAMQQSQLNDVTEARGISIGIVAPDGRDGMLRHAAGFAKAGIPFIFDPGQAMPLFGGQDLKGFIEQASWVTVNDYEWSLMSDRTGWSEADVTKRVAALVVTRGGEGSTVFTADGKLDVPLAPARTVVDPTGCGDAYRAGLLHGLLHELSWEKTTRIASLMGSLKIESRGTQNHSFTPADFRKRYENIFGQL